MTVSSKSNPMSAAGNKKDLKSSGNAAAKKKRPSKATNGSAGPNSFKDGLNS